MQKYSLTKTFCNVSQLQTEINTSTLIIPSCISINYEMDVLDIYFVTSITNEELNHLENIVNNHTPTPQNVDVSTLPISTLDGYKLSVHSSAMPHSSNTVYAQWIGAGDDPNDPSDIGSGNMLHFNFTKDDGITSKSIDIQFNKMHGRVWIHEAYLRFEGGGCEDFIEGTIMAKATNLQQFVNLDLIVDDKWIKYSPNGSGTGTHGFADTNIQLIPRSFSKDGDWDYDTVLGLRPNLTSTGMYKISNQELAISRYFNRLSCCGSCPTYFSMTSDETAELPAGFFVRITAHNKTNQTWHASVIVEIFRERTLVP